MQPDEAINVVLKKFPFNGYLRPDGGKGSYTNIANTVMRYLSPGSRILDFGCGPCDKTAILQVLGYKCSGFDDLQDHWHLIHGNLEKILSFAKDCDIDFRLARDHSFLPFEKNSFDMIMLHDVLEHLHDSPRDLLNDLLELAKPDALLFVTVPNAANIRKRIDLLFGKTNLPSFESYYWYPGSWRGHIREYVRDDLVQLSKYLDLEVLKLGGCDHMLQKLPVLIRPAYLFVTKIFSGWKDSWLLIARKRKNWVPKKTLSKDELSQILGKSTTFVYPKQ